MAVTPEKLCWTGLAVPGFYPGAQPVFTTPYVDLPAGPVDSQPFSRMSYRQGVTVLKKDGAYIAGQGPTDEQIAAADEVYLGGHSTTLTTTDEIAALEAAGYEVQGP